MCPNITGTQASTEALASCPALQNGPFKKESREGPGEMAQRLRTVAALPEEPGLTPGTHMTTPDCL